MYIYYGPLQLFDIQKAAVNTSKTSTFRAKALRREVDESDYEHLVLGRRTANFTSAKKTFDSHSPEAVCNSPVLAVMTS
jgi:hypothetical protein